LNRKFDLKEIIMAKGTIDSGICGFITEVITSKGEKGKIKVDIKTDCPNFTKVAKEFTEVDPYKEVLVRYNKTLICELSSKHSPHPSCPIPSGILKTIEVEAGLALPKNASITIEKD
jgi:hypothetical protein